jgi:hypothetical protein
MFTDENSGNMTEFDQADYGRGYALAESDIAAHGYAQAQEIAYTLSHLTRKTWFETGYVTCVNAWKDGVRL